jgi:hypothetical protein
MKLGVSYTVFDGIELLEYSIKQIRNHVDFIHVAYQEYSWFGIPISPEDLDTLNTLTRKGLIDSLEKFSSFKKVNVSPTSIRVSKGFETAKRQFGLKSCLAKNCTHFISMDVDEFYKSGEFKMAKDKIIEEDISLTSCGFINYVNLPIYHRGYDGSTVPFICKVNNKTKHQKGFFSKCDPTRGLNKTYKGKNYKFSKNELTMHHMETVRKDLFKKYYSTTRAVFNRKKTRELIGSIKSVNEKNKKLNFKKIIFPSLGSIPIVECDNLFKIKYELWK